MSADWVSLKVDAVDSAIWRQNDRPHRSLHLSPILEGLLAFAGHYGGELVTETMLVAGVNDGPRHLRGLAAFLARLQPDRAYLSIPTRPPAEPWVQAPAEEVVNRAYHILREEVSKVEYLIGYEGNAFAFTGDVEQDLLSITAVHPMREDAVSDYLARAGAGWTAVQRLVAEGQLAAVKYREHAFYLRKLQSPRRDA
ncbi:MAG: hypothetical protein GX597_16325 [Anaerolineaceae bacterium]|nr:hypothetical protein [Anaerolineaceae bacterium]